MELSDEIREGLASLFLWWYGNHACIRHVLRHGWTTKEHCGEPRLNVKLVLQELPPRALEEAWRQRWFAKGHLTHKVDLLIRANFSWLLRETALQTFQPRELWEKLALIILYDQVTRNAFRSTPQAYDYDEIALSIALELMEKRELTFCFQATICICLCHAESQEIQEKLQQYLAMMGSSLHGHEELHHALEEISNKHRERIEEFGRFPERNDILQRTCTPREAAYLAQLGG